MSEKITIIRQEFPDSISIGREIRGGLIKVYLNCSDIEQCEKRIDNMIRSRQYLLQKLGGALD